MTDVTLILLAAGAATRMRGTDKLLEQIDGTPLILRQTRAALASGAPVTVVLPDGNRPRRAWITDCPVQIVTTAEVSMSASIRSGAATAPGAVMILLADMPQITATDIAQLLTTFRADPTRIVQATTAQGTPGHPVIFPADLRPALLALSGDQGARPILAAHPDRITKHPLPGQNARFDLDTPEEWTAWRAAHVGASGGDI